MKNLFVSLLYTLGNILLFYILLFMAVMVVFGLFGEGEYASKQAVWVSFCFSLFQIGVIVVANSKLKRYKSVNVLVLNILIIIGLFVFTILM